MSQSYDKEFKALQSISRSEEMKMQSIYQINQKKRLDEKPKQIFNLRFIPYASFLVLFLVAIFAGTNLFQNSASISDHHFMYDIHPSQVVHTFAAPSVSRGSFKAKQQDGIPLVGVRRYEASKDWSFLLVEAFSNATRTAVNMEDEPHIDFLLPLEGKRPLQLKLWLYPDGTGYVSEHGSEDMYQLKEGNAIQLTIAFDDLLQMEGD